MPPVLPSALTPLEISAGFNLAPLIRIRHSLIHFTKIVTSDFFKPEDYPCLSAFFVLHLL